MPPKRRQPRPPDPEPEPPRPASPPPDRDGDQSPSEEEDDSIAEHSPLPFYNTTFSAHRVSPLYLGAESLTTNRLQILAQRLRDRLVGDVVRGVEVGVQAADREDSMIGRAGALERVEIAWVGLADVLGFSGEDVENSEAEDVEDGDGTTGWRQAVRAGELREKRALHISLRYEMASCTALMLPALLGDGKKSGVEGATTRFSVGGGADEMDWEHSVDPTHFLSLPLLLLRMPAPLKTIIGEFLSTTFDCRVSPMRLGTRSLVRSWEAWIRSAGLPSRGPLAKDMVLTLGFYISPSDPVPTQPSEEDAAAEQQQPLGLKSIDVIIPATELGKFATAGKRVAKTQGKQTASPTGWGWDNDPKKRRKLAGRLYEEGWEWRTASPEGRPPEHQPFTEALACYLKEHLGLNLFHPSVRVIKIACGGFAMSESRLKLFAPAGSGDAEGEGLPLLAQRGAVLELLGRLADKAQITVSV
ncbi:kinetochore complex Sim4 subunit Fta1-domain-containing protein [Parachaetomium inaequale]|uniref:Kinetochore complex Sim4 subunit Fta1-domain-containing protein n=1 Tax=Parachaetomium inaequale TaxID=2588326 RepID=A0AAN6P775_9PEZI|nr:kinetochore complex Sim4 subunit Fta1-domain-containing protein [Parachaetomium inaequale]